MNAKMVVTVPVEQIPEEVSKLIENIVDRLKKTTDALSNCTYNENHSFVVEQIDLLRQDLSLIDLNLEDSYSILLGYIKYKTDKRASEQQANQKEQSNDSNTNG